MQIEGGEWGFTARKAAEPLDDDIDAPVAPGHLGYELGQAVAGPDIDATKTGAGEG